MHRFRRETLNFSLSVIQKFVEVDASEEDCLAVLLLVKVFRVSLHPFRLPFPHHSPLPPFLTLFHSLSFTPYIPWWLTCVSVMSLTPSLLLCLTAPFRSTLEPETMWRSPPHTLLHIFPSCISCAVPVFTPLAALFSSFVFFFYISCRSVVALGDSVFCWSVTSSPLCLTPLSSAVCFSPLTLADSLSL